MSNPTQTQTQNQTQTPSEFFRRGRIIKVRINLADLEDVEERVDIITGAMIYDIKVLLAKHGKKELCGLVEEIVRNYIERIKVEYDMLITGSED
ncbi:MAG: hypothetical protein QXO22_06565 [Thermosphaera sp.]